MMSTLSEAIAHFEGEGFTEHFGVRGNQPLGFESGTRFGAHEVVIRGFDRFERISDPDDMAIVYTIETRSGLRGTLTDAFGIYSNPQVGAFVRNVALEAQRGARRSVRRERRQP
jgi:hypothetical protein